MAPRFPRRTGTAGDAAHPTRTAPGPHARRRFRALCALALAACAAALAAAGAASATAAGRDAAQQGPAAPQSSPTPYVRPRTVGGRAAPPEATPPEASPREVRPPEEATPRRGAGEEPAPPAGDDAPQEVGEDEVVRVDSNLVLIPASVLDARGRAVTDLKLEDFELRVDGEVQPISDLSRAESPVHIAMLFDNSSSLSAAREFEKQAAVRFFRSIVRPVDRAAVYAVSTTPTLSQPLTADVNRLVGTIEGFGKPDGATALFDALAQAAEYMRPVAGRKVLVVVSDGADTVSDVAFEEAVRLALRAECQVYVVQTRQVEEPNLRDPVSEERMQKLSEQTGGAVFVPKAIEDLDAAFAQIALDLSQQYLLSYYPPQGRKDNYFRFIALGVKTRPGLRVRARKGFYPLSANAGPSTTGEGLAAPRRLTDDGRAARPSTREAARPAAPAPRPAPDAQARRVGPAGPDEEEAARRPARGAELTTLTIKVADPVRPEPEVASAAAAQPSGQAGQAGQAGGARPDTAATTQLFTPAPRPSPAPTPAPQPAPTPEPAPAAAEKDSQQRSEQKEVPAEKRTVSGGVLNSKALNLPKPVYPPAARQTGVFGVVLVAVTIDERGRVAEAKAVSGPILLHAAAVAAARQARFSPATLSGEPARMSGTISYNFVRQ